MRVVVELHALRNALFDTFDQVVAGHGVEVAVVDHLESLHLLVALHELNDQIGVGFELGQALFELPNALQLNQVHVHVLGQQAHEAVRAQHFRRVVPDQLVQHLQFGVADQL